MSAELKQGKLMEIAGRVVDSPRLSGAVGGILGLLAVEISGVEGDTLASVAAALGCAFIMATVPFIGKEKDIPKE